MNKLLTFGLVQVTAFATIVLCLCPSAECYSALILEYTFDDQSDPTSNSGTLGPTYDGDLQGNATFEPFGGGFAVSLDGDVSPNSVVIPEGSESSFDIGDSDFSLFARFQTSYSDTSTSRVRSLIWKEAQGSDPMYVLGVRQETGQAQFSLADGVDFVNVDSTTALNDGLTHTLLGVRQDNLIGLFVDGVLDAVTTIPGGFGSTNNNNDLVIGGRTVSSASGWVGLIDEIQVHDTAVENIPEPSALLSAGLSVFVLGLWRKPHRSRKPETTMRTVAT